MNALGEQLLQVAKQYIGPAAQQFLTRELRALDCNADTVAPTHLEPLSARARVSAARFMDQARAEEFGTAVAQLAVAPIERHATSTAGGAPLRLGLDAAGHLLTTGKLRQAEEAYRQLAQKHGDPDAYRGLANTAIALEDVPAALLALRDGAAVLSRKGARQDAIALLAEAVALAPGDLAAHRRLAAALANSGDAEAACDEYARFVDHAFADGDSRRAWLELTYARETLGDLPRLVQVVDRLMPGAARVPTIIAGQSVAPVAPPIEDRPVARVEPMLPTIKLDTPPPSSPPPDIRRLVPAEPPAPQRIAPEDLPRTRPVGAPSALHLADSQTLTSFDTLDEAPIGLLARTAPRRVGARPTRPPLDTETTLSSLVPAGTPEEAAGIAAMRATILIGAHDARATEAALDAARRLLALHKLQAASDLLLDYIGAGFTDREAQRLLIEVDCGLGRRDVARDKCRLLGQAYRLDGKIDTADDVERLASII